MKHTLRRPISIPGVPTITELNLREELCAGDFRGIKRRQFFQEWDGTDMIKLISRLSGQPEAVIGHVPNGMSEQDLDDIGEKLVGFFKREDPPQAGPQTQATSSQ